MELIDQENKQEYERVMHPYTKRKRKNSRARTHKTKNVHENMLKNSLSCRTFLTDFPKYFRRAYYSYTRMESCIPIVRRRLALGDLFGRGGLADGGEVGVRLALRE